MAALRPALARALRRRLCTGGHDFRLPQQASSHRTLATSADLVPILQSELADERSNGATVASPELQELEGIMREAGFSVEDDPGHSEVRLVRTQGTERMVVGFDCEPEPADEVEGEDEDEHAPHPFSVTLEKGSERLMFHCIAHEGLEVVRVTFPPAGADVEEAFSGPPFLELDEELQHAFNMFLYDRDVDSQMAEYVHLKAASKESTEYCRWMEGIAAFVHK
eukprot:g659.t1